jgi:hypothetical protein
MSSIVETRIFTPLYPLLLPAALATLFPASQAAPPEVEG